MKKLEDFPLDIRKKNKDSYLIELLGRSSKGEGYLEIKNGTVVLTQYLTGRLKADRDRLLDNKAKGIVTF